MELVIDHVGLIVGSTDIAVKQYKSMGFKVARVDDCESIGKVLTFLEDNEGQILELIEPWNGSDDFGKVEHIAYRPAGGMFFKDTIGELVSEGYTVIETLKIPEINKRAVFFRGRNAEIFEVVGDIE